LDEQSAVGIATALTTVHSEGDTQKMEHATRCLLFDLWNAIDHVELERILGQSWAGEVLRGMQDHERAREAARRAFEDYEDPVNVQKRREEKKAVKQKKHQERLALKKERDQIRREKDGKSE